MKKLFTPFLAVAFALIVSACATGPVTVQPPNPLVSSVECNQKLDAIAAGKTGVSLIRQRIPSPCDAYKIALTVAKAGVIWDLYEVDQLVTWSNKVKNTVAAGLSYEDLNLLLSAQVRAFNEQLGGTYLLLSELLVAFNDASIISESDQAILIAGFDGVVSEARRLAFLYCSNIVIPSDFPGKPFTSFRG